MKIHLSKGNRHDAKITPEIINKLAINESKEEKFILADKAYDSKKIRELIKSKKYKPLIAKRRYKNRKIKVLKKKYLKIYKKRIIVENTFSWLKAYPKIDKKYMRKA